MKHVVGPRPLNMVDRTDAFGSRPTAKLYNDFFFVSELIL